MGQRAEQHLIQQLVAEPAVEPLEGVLGRFAARDVVPGDTALSAQRSIALDVSSVPLSETIAAGLARPTTIRSSSRATLRPEIEVSATSARHPRACSRPPRQGSGSAGRRPSGRARDPVTSALLQRGICWPARAVAHARPVGADAIAISAPDLRPAKAPATGGKIARRARLHIGLAAAQQGAAAEGAETLNWLGIGSFPISWRRASVGIKAIFALLFGAQSAPRSAGRLISGL